MIASARIASSTTYRESSTSCRSSCTCCRIVFVPNRHVRRTSHGRRRDLDEHTSRQRRRQPRVCSTQWGSRRMDARWTLPGRNRAAGARAARRPAWAASGSASWQRDALILTASSIRKGSPVRVRSWALNNLRANGASCRSRPHPDKGRAQGRRPCRLVAQGVATAETSGSATQSRSNGLRMTGNIPRAARMQIGDKSAIRGERSGARLLLRRVL